MKLGSNLIIKKVDDVEEKVDFLIEFCTSLQQENEELSKKNKELESALGKMSNAGQKSSEQETLIQAKVDSLLKKLSDFSGVEHNRH